MAVWQTPQPPTSMVTSSGQGSPTAVSGQSKRLLATLLSPLLAAGAERALCAGRGVVIGGLLTHNSNDRSKNPICEGYLGSEIEEVIVITTACDLVAGERAAKMHWPFL